MLQVIKPGVRITICEKHRTYHYEVINQFVHNTKSPNEPQNPEFVAEVLEWTKGFMSEIKDRFVIIL